MCWRRGSGSAAGLRQTPGRPEPLITRRPRRTAAPPCPLRSTGRSTARWQGACWSTTPAARWARLCTSSRRKRAAWRCQTCSSRRWGPRWEGRMLRGGALAGGRGRGKDGLAGPAGAAAAHSIQLQPASGGWFGAALPLQALAPARPCSCSHCCMLLCAWGWPLATSAQQPLYGPRCARLPRPRADLPAGHRGRHARHRQRHGLARGPAVGALARRGGALPCALHPAPCACRVLLCVPAALCCCRSSIS